MKVNFSIINPYPTMSNVRTKIVKPEESKNAPLIRLNEDAKDTFISGDRAQVES